MNYDRMSRSYAVLYLTMLGVFSTTTWPIRLKPVLRNKR